MTSSKKSSSLQPASAPIATVAGSALDNTVNTNYLAYVSAAAAAAGLNFQQADDDLSPGDEDPSDDSPGDETPGDDVPGDTTGNETPLLSDISVISNEVVLDAANIPTVRVVFRVTNSSGQELTGVDVRVKKV